MSDPGLRRATAERVAGDRPGKPLGRLLVNAGLIDSDTLMQALQLQSRVDAPLGEILVADGLVAERDVLDALSLQNRTDRIDLAANPPQSGVGRCLPATLCMAKLVVPWRRIGRTVLVATARPDLFEDVVQALPPGDLNLLPVVAAPQDIRRAITQLYGTELAQAAVTRVPDALSARRWQKTGARRAGMAMLAFGLMALALVHYPLAAMLLVLGWCVLTLILTAALKAATLVAQISHNLVEHPKPPPENLRPFRLPQVSVMVPLYKEKEIARLLVSRLERLTYPKSLLDVVLVLEAKDHVTRETLQYTKLPPWMSVVEVPDDGTITTKPRALNYALGFCRGSIIGVWDAEDAPEADQLEKVVMRFYSAPAHVGCLQGILDYYNARANWIARCFAIEYATWFRLILPGMARLGLVVPLGGTTLFFRRKVLEELGAWDAHNVTEDADLGVRLARRGYVTELLHTVTYEEANFRPFRWVRQRSRWLKGFLITYCVHMRHPRQLLADLGWRRVLGLQIIFLATVTQFAALPLLWTFWLPMIGWPHPVMTAFGATPLKALGALFLLVELLNIVMGMIAVSGPKHRHLLPWVLSMPIYFTLGAFAAYKALFELIFSPFYWDKTQHGVTTPSGTTQTPRDLSPNI